MPGFSPYSIHVRDEDAVYIMAPLPEYLKRSISFNETAEALDAPIAAFDARRLRVIGRRTEDAHSSNGLLKDCLDLCPNQEKLREFCLKKILTSSMYIQMT